MGETTLAEVATTARHQGETLVRLERKIDSNHVSLENKIDGNFKWLLAIILGGFGALGLVILGAPHVFPPSAPASVAPQYSPGGYTLTVNPYPTASSPAEDTAPTSASSN